MCLFLLNTRQSAKAIRCALTHTHTTARINWKLIANGIADVEQNAYEHDSQHCHRQHFTNNNNNHYEKCRKFKTIGYLLSDNAGLIHSIPSSHIHLYSRSCMVSECVRVCLNLCRLNFVDDVNAYISNMKSVRTAIFTSPLSTPICYTLGVYFFVGLIAHW